MTHTKKDFHKFLSEHEFHVTEEWIAKGKKCVAGACPVALAIIDALNKQFKQLVQVLVTQDTVTITSDDAWYLEYKTTENTEKFIKNFDSGKQPSPFSFKLGEEIQFVW